MKAKLWLLWEKTKQNCKFVQNTGVGSHINQMNSAILIVPVRWSKQHWSPTLFHPPAPETPERSWLYLCEGVPPEWTLSGSVVAAEAKDRLEPDWALLKLSATKQERKCQTHLVTADWQSSESKRTQVLTCGRTLRPRIAVRFLTMDRLWPGFFGLGFGLPKPLLLQNLLLFFP